MTEKTNMTSKYPSTPITQQPRSTSKLSPVTRLTINARLDNEICERAWSSGLCACYDDKRHSCMTSICCWPYFKYTMGMRIGESPFVPLIPCAMYGFRVKIRTLFSIKGSVVEDFFAALLCEPCVVCQLTRELDVAGL